MSLTLAENVKFGSVAGIKIAQRQIWRLKLSGQNSYQIIQFQELWLLKRKSNILL